jgi:NAD(P)-dependent dehydrogenase (short-subunit alcohol dehydrogenase family)
MLLKDKVAVITGAGSGVGRATARRFAEEGASVVCVDIDLDRAKETVAELEAAGRRAVAERCDVSLDADMAAVIAGTVGQFGRLDIMFNNVGIPTPRLGMIFEEHSVEGAVHQLTRAVAVEVAPFGIRVNAICPAGMPYTGFMAAGGMELSGKDLEAVATHTGSMHPLGKPITAEDCAEAAVYLCSDGSANVTGILLPIDGGYIAK